MALVAANTIHSRGPGMGIQNDAVAVMFTDICDSASVYQQLGDADARSLGANCLRLISEAARRNGGRIIKTIGDGAMITFETVENAYRAASVIQLAIRGRVVRVKIGLHFGRVIEAGEDVFGDTVNLAARLLARAGAGEILMTGECVETLGPEQRATVRLLDTTSVKGRPEAVEIYRVLGSTEDATTVVPSSTLPPAHSALVLSYRGTTLRLDATAGPVLIGRDATCALVVDSVWASRMHATLDLQRGRFVLTDHSANGTFIAAEGGTERQLRREGGHLSSHGTISIGIGAQGNPQDLVRYRCELASGSR